MSVIPSQQSSSRYTTVNYVDDKALAISLRKPCQEAHTGQDGHSETQDPACVEIDTTGQTDGLSDQVVCIPLPPLGFFFVLLAITDFANGPIQKRSDLSESQYDFEKLCNSAGRLCSPFVLGHLPLDKADGYDTSKFYSHHQAGFSTDLSGLFSLL